MLSNSSTFALITLFLIGCNSTEHFELSKPIKLEIQVDSINATVSELDSLFSITLNYYNQQYIVEPQNGKIQLPIRNDTAITIIVKFGSFLVEGDTSVFKHCCYNTFYFPTQENFFFRVDATKSSNDNKIYEMIMGSSQGDWGGKLYWNNKTKMFETHGWGE